MSIGNNCIKANKFNINITIVPKRNRKGDNSRIILCTSLFLVFHKDYAYVRLNRIKLFKFEFFRSFIHPHTPNMLHGLMYVFVLFVSVVTFSFQWPFVEVTNQTQ